MPVCSFVWLLSSVLGKQLVLERFFLPLQEMSYDVSDHIISQIKLMGGTTASNARLWLRDYRMLGCSYACTKTRRQLVPLIHQLFNCGEKRKALPSRERNWHLQNPFLNLSRSVPLLVPNHVVLFLGRPDNDKHLGSRHSDALLRELPPPLHHKSAFLLDDVYPLLHDLLLAPVGND